MRLLIIVFMFLLTSTAFAKPYEFVEYQYTVEAGDNLDSITDKFIVYNTYGKRTHEDFKAGICELNLIVDRDVEPGEIITITWWKKT